MDLDGSWQPIRYDYWADILKAAKQTSFRGLSPEERLSVEFGPLQADSSQLEGWRDARLNTMGKDLAQKHNQNIILTIDRLRFGSWIVSISGNESTEQAD